MNTRSIHKRLLGWSALSDDQLNALALRARRGGLIAFFIAGLPFLLSLIALTANAHPAVAWWARSEAVFQGAQIGALLFLTLGACLTLKWRDLTPLSASKKGASSEALALIRRFDTARAWREQAIQTREMRGFDLFVMRQLAHKEAERVSQGAFLNNRKKPHVKPQAATRTNHDPLIRRQQ